MARHNGRSVEGLPMLYDNHLIMKRTLQSLMTRRNAPGASRSRRRYFADGLFHRVGNVQPPGAVIGCRREAPRRADYKANGPGTRPVGVRGQRLKAAL